MRTSLIAAVALALSLSGCVVAASDQPASYDGDWSGTWTLADDTASGSVAMSLHHTGSRVSGTIDLGGSLCVPSGDVSASVDAHGFSGGYSSGFGTVDLDGDLNGAGDFDGTFDVVSGLCNGAHGSFLMHH